MESIKARVLELLMEYGLKLAIAILVVAVGFTIVNISVKIMDNTLSKSKIDKSIHSFVKSISNFFSKIIITIIAATILGIPPATFIAVLSAAGLAIGLALKDSLSNFAGGILILIFRPFNVGDFIDMGGSSGTVKDIQLFYTALNTTDNRRITIPNGELANGKIINYSVEATRRLDLVFSVSYEDDIHRVKETLTKIMMGHPLIFKDPEPVVRVVAYQDSCVDFTVKVWCNREDYWTIYYDLHEQVKVEFDKEGITIPFPQTVVNLHQQSNK